MQELDRLGWVVRNAYKISDYTFAVRTTSERFGVWVDEVLAAYKTDEPTDENFYSIVIPEGEGMGRGRKFAILYRGVLALLRTTHIPSIGELLLSELESLEYEERADAVFLDAAVVSANGGKALVPSPSMLYVSTLGRGLKKTGLQIPLHTSVALDTNTGMVIPVPHSLDIATDAIQRLELEFPTEAAPERVRFKEPTWVDAVISIGVEEQLVMPVSQGTAVYRLASHVMNMFRVERVGLQAMGELVGRARCYEVKSTKPRATAETFANILRAISSP